MTPSDAEREAIIRAAAATQGKVSTMADHLGIGRTTLWRKLKRYDIDLEKYKG